MLQIVFPYVLERRVGGLFGGALESIAAEAAYSTIVISFALKIGVAPSAGL
jgi:hypothetical protein